MRPPSRKVFGVKMTSTLQRAKTYFVFLAVLMLCVTYVAYKWTYPGKPYTLPYNDSVIFNVNAREFMAVKSVLKETDKRIDKLLQTDLNLTTNEAAKDIIKMITGNDTISGKTWSQIDLKTRDEMEELRLEMSTVRDLNMSIIQVDNTTKPPESSVTNTERFSKLDNGYSSLEWLATTLGPVQGPENDKGASIHIETTSDLMDKIQEELKKVEQRIQLNNKNKKLNDTHNNHPGTSPMNRSNRKARGKQVKHHAFDDSKGHTGFSPLLPDGRADSCVTCFQTDFSELINNRELCAKGDVDLLIVIESTWDKFWARDSIRETWGQICTKPESRVKCAFFFGNRHYPQASKTLKREQEKYNDIVQYDFIDSYANLTYKTILALKWSTKYCSKAKYVMKTDDDMYINTEMLPYIIEAIPSKRFIGGHCWGASSPHRERSSKWYVSFQQYTHPTFPSMCSGTGYIMSRDLVDGIVELSPNIPFFHLEDVYIAICVKRLGVKPTKIDGFNNQAVEFNSCRYRNYVITSHGYQGGALKSAWSEAQRCPLSSMSPDIVYRGMQL